MSRRNEKLLGRKIGKLTFEKFLGSEKTPSGKSHRYWYLAKCDCGIDCRIERGQFKKMSFAACHSCRVKRKPERVNTAREIKKMGEFRNIATVIRRHRNNMNISQQDFSRMLGYRSGQFLSNVERGLCSITFRDIPKISEVLKIEQKDLVNAVVDDYRARVEKAISEGTWRN